jgi:hypothetical protein
LQQQQLKRLELVDLRSSEDVGEDEPEIALFISEIGSENVGLRNVEYFSYNFDISSNNALALASYMPNLRELEARYVRRASDLEFFLDETRFHRLTSLRLENYNEQEDEEEIEINGSNTTITKLEWIECWIDIELILLSLKGLKHLMISYGASRLSKPLMEFIAANMMNLETIEADAARNTEVLEFYEQMKKEREDINKNIRISFNLK